MPEQVPNEKIGDRVRQLREKRGWSLSDLAEKSKISRSYLYQIERSESAPTEDKIKKLADALDARPSELLGERFDAVEIPASLQEFAEQSGLSTRELTMLAQIEYRGRKPTTPREWRAIYSVIKAMLEEEEEAR